MSGRKILEGLQDAIKGNFASVTIEGQHWMRRDPPEELAKEMADAMQPYREQISGTPALLSLLYDIDLLPEQIRLPVNVGRLIAVCELFKRLPPEAVTEMLAPR